MNITEKIDKILFERSLPELKKEISDLRKGKLTSLGKKRLKELEDELFLKNIK